MSRASFNRIVDDNLLGCIAHDVDDHEDLISAWERKTLRDVAWIRSRLSWRFCPTVRTQDERVWVDTTTGVVGDVGICISKNLAYSNGSTPGALSGRTLVVTRAVGINRLENLRFDTIICLEGISDTIWWHNEDIPCPDDPDVAARQCNENESALGWEPGHRLVRYSYVGKNPGYYDGMVTVWRGPIVHGMIYYRRGAELRFPHPQIISFDWTIISHGVIISP